MKAVVFYANSYQVTHDIEDEKPTMRIAVPVADKPGEYEEREVTLVRHLARVLHFEFFFYVEEGKDLPSEEDVAKASYDWFAAMVVEAHLAKIHEQIEGQRRILTPNEAKEREGVVVPMKPGLIS